MTPQQDAQQYLERRLARLAEVLQVRPDALGLLALGSVGLETARIDAWSDLDFFVIVRPGAKSAYIARLDWLAEAHPLVWHFQNTVDGHKALMADGLFCEFAVFEPQELARIPYAPGRFVWRHDELPAALAQPAMALPAPAERAWLIGELLSNLIIGLQRHARGEHLAAARMVQVHALHRLLELLDLQRPSAPGLRDPFNADRRVELRHPAQRAFLAQAAGGYASTPQAAAALLQQLLDLGLPVDPAAAARVRQLIDITLTHTAIPEAS